MSKLNNEKRFWKTIDEFKDLNALNHKKQNEFEKGVTDDFELNDLNKLSRRKFLAVTAAAGAITATACSDYRDKGEIVPYNKRPEGLLPGTPNYYATNVNGIGVLVKTREGRPINIEGNPEHPIYKGKVDAITISSILNLYDPERLKFPIKEGRQIKWTEADDEIISRLNEISKSGKEIAVFSKRLNSPTADEVLKKFKDKFPTTTYYFYETLGNQRKVQAAEKNYGTKFLPLIDWSKVKIVVSLESDFLSREEEAVYNAQNFALRRDIMKTEDFIRLYSIEGSLSLTGANADYRIPLRSDLIHEFVLSLINEISKKNSGLSLSNENQNLISKYSLKNFVHKHNLDSLKVSYLLNDLLKNHGNSIVLAGDELSEETQLAVNLLNEILGYDFVLSNDGRIYNEDLIDDEILSQFIAKVNSGKIGAFINFDSDPVFHLSYNKKLKDALKKVNLKISLSFERNDTSEICDFVLPVHHDLESWNLFQKFNSIIDLQQPVIEPIFNTRQKENVLLTWMNGTKSYSEKVYKNFIKEFFTNKIYPKTNLLISAESFWFNSLHDGFIFINSEIIKNNFNQIALHTLEPIKNSITCKIEKSYFIGDGKFANNGWLQEIPHPVTKITWDNFAAISPKFAEQNSLKMGDVVLVKSKSAQIEIPIVIQPGNAENMISIEAGYGRNVIGEVGFKVGVNPLVLIESESKNKFVFNVEIRKTNKTYQLASTQEHHAVDDTRIKDLHKKRNIIREGTLSQYKNNKHFLHEKDHNLVGITREHKYEGVKWAMAIDLNKCTSCGTCVSACNVENNVPIVGKDQVLKGREMHWIRIDRYYSGTPENPEISNQPMLCQHCDNAPCENVCPVNATNHSPDGLNQMVYNRCVGTRYCSNNCPYKVRRFNFFNFRDHFADSYYENELTSLLNNPEVTVRSRGVMEKCTFCVQRIMEARSEAIKNGEEWNGQNMKTACQSACPSEAIVFGNVNDENSEIYKYRNHEIAYHVLEELYVKPNVTYIAKLRNTITEES